MLEALGSPMLVSNIRMTWQLAQYLKRYTTKKVGIVTGGPGYDMDRGLFNKKDYEGMSGGIMEALGVLFKNDVTVYQYPNIDADGSVRKLVPPSGSNEFLWRYLKSQ